MKKRGILHPELAYAVANIGHTDYMLFADKGYPIPQEVERINLGFTDNQPTIIQVLQVLVEEMVIDRIIITQEMADVSPKRVNELQVLFPEIKFEKVSHIELKQLSKKASYAVKTGDTTPYANLIVVSG